MSKLIANQIQSIGGSALTLPTTLPSGDSTLKVNSSGVMSYEASAGGGATDSRVFCGSVDFKHDSGVGSSVIISKPATLSADKIRSYEIHFYGVGFSGDTSYQLRWKPYKSGSSVMTGNDFRGNGYYSYNGTSSTGWQHSFSSYLSAMYAGGTGHPYNNPGSGSGPIQDSDYSSAYSGKLSGVISYENNFKYPAYSYRMHARTSSNTYYHYNEYGMFSSSSSKTTSDYTEQFYFYPGSGSFDEGIIAVYAIKKSDT